MTNEESLVVEVARQCGETMAEAVVEQIKKSAKKTGWLVWGSEVYKVTEVHERDTFGGDEGYWALTTNLDGDE